MKDKRIKLIAYLTACSMFLSGCKMELDSILNKDKATTPTKSIINSETTIEETYETQNTEVNEDNNELATVTEPTIYETEISTIPTIEETQPIIKEEQVTATTEVNIRSSNTSESLKIGSLKIYETAYKLLSCDNNWDLVRHDEGIGYVCRDYLEYSGEYMETEYEHQEYSDIVLTKTDLNLRIAPNTDSEIILTFNANTELQVVAKVDNGWLLVKHNENFGYVHGDYTISLLDKINEQYPELNISEIDIKKIIYTNATDLNIRTGNSTEYERIGNLETYESARVIAEYDDWYLILTNEYNIGFINKNYTKELDGIFIVVDISKQRLYMYYNNELCYIAKVTTGKDSTPSDIGLFKIWYMGENEEITPGYVVDYWMPYNSAVEGLHDAERWRKDGYGTEVYKYGGSNGCINMRLKDARTIYNNVSIGTRVLVQK